MTRLICVLIGVLVLSCQSRAESFGAIYVFGDSFSDMGARFVDGNGPTAVVYLAQRMGLSMTFPKDPDAKGKSLNFAASGARTGTEPGVTVKGRYWGNQGMMDQVQGFERGVREGAISFDPETTLFFIAGGLNDRDLPTEVTVRNLTQEIQLLAKLHARHITLALLPTKLPCCAKTAERLNPAYRRLVSDLKDTLDIDMQLSDWGLYFDAVFEQPSRYGIINITSRCAGRALFNEDTTPCATPETYFYFHEDHPSTAVHRIVGEKLYRELVARKMHPTRVR